MAMMGMMGEKGRRNRYDLGNTMRTQSSIECKKWNLISLRTSCGTSSRSALFFSGNNIVRMPARCAPKTFSRIPPTGKTLPRSEISPVMAIVAGIDTSLYRLNSAQKMATPAEGPSFGVAPAGTCTWMSSFSKSIDALSFASQPRNSVVAARMLYCMTSPNFPVMTS